MTMPTFVDAAFVQQGQLNLLSTALVNQGILLTGVPPPRTYVPTVVANLTGTTGIANITDTVVTFGASAINNDGMRTAGVDHFTVQTGGVYVVWAQMQWAANATGVRVGHILLNGTSVYNSVAAASMDAPSGTDTSTMHLETPPMVLAPGATFYFSAWQSSGGSLNLTNTFGGTFMAALRMGNQM